MDPICDLFDNLDKWCNLPAYQLERRSDIFFSLYLPTALAEKTDKPVRSKVIPEFPVKQDSSNLTDKIDYLAVREDGTELVLVELKTDEKSIRPKQMEYLCQAAKRGGPQICRDLAEVISASKFKKKYAALRDHLRADLGLDMGDPETWPRICRVILVKPLPDLDEKYWDLFSKNKIALDVISFRDFDNTVGQFGDPLSLRFRESLAGWALR